MLRRKCVEVPKEDIKKKEIRDVLSAMHAALVRYQSMVFGLPNNGLDIGMTGSAYLHHKLG